MFTDTITIYKKQADQEAWDRIVVPGVQWADKYEKKNEGGKIQIARYATITFPEGTFEGLTLDPGREEDAIVYGSVSDTVTAQKGQRISDLLSKYERSGRIKAVNDNSNRSLLKNIKVVVA